MSTRSLASNVDVESDVKGNEEASRRHKAQADAAAHQDMDPARLGGELSAEDRPADESETAETLKRGD
jgi:hypothetical protein